MITQEEHIANSGAKCPHCGSDEIEGGEVITGNGCATQEMGCLSCDAEWEDVYTLTGYR